MKDYKNRKQMFKDFNIDTDNSANVLNAIYDNHKIVIGNHTIEYDYTDIKTLATSRGTYGANGAVVSVTIPGHFLPDILAITDRTVTLLKVI